MKGRNTMNQHNTFSKGRALHLHVAGHSETGQVRERNADAYALYDLSDCEELVRLASEIGGDENISIIILSFSGDLQ